MTKKKNNIPKSQTRSKYILWALWLTGASPILWYYLLRKSYTDANTTVVLLIASYILILLISALLPNRKKNNTRLLIAAFVLLLISTIMTLDYWAQIALTPSCGSGFSAGNCLLLDGLGVILYPFIIAPLLLCATIVLTMNYLKKQ